MSNALPIVGKLGKLWNAVYAVRDSSSWIGLSAENSSRADANHFGEMLLQSPKYRDPRKLNHHELQIFSQGGEDGIIAEIFRRISPVTKRFVEFGTEDGLETNTTYLLARGWSGVWIEGDRSAVDRATERFQAPVDTGRLAIRGAYVSAENAAELIAEAGVPEEFDLLSLDIDRNTYYVWQALSAYKPRVVVVEYNASIPPSDEWVVEYEKDKMWNGTVYFGAGLKSYEILGRSLRYALVGCSLNGVNAFFVREDLVGDRFAEPFTAENHHEPPRYWLQWRNGHPRSFAG